MPVLLNNAQVGWVRVGIGRQRAMQEMQRIVQEGVLYALAAVITGICIAWFIGGRLTKRLYDIKQTIDQVKNHSPENRINISGTDELTDLSVEFNAMLDTLAEREQELRRVNTTLEDEVAKRTEMLTESLSLVEYREQELRTLLDTATDGIHILDASGRVVEFSHSFARMLGYTPEEMWNLSVYDWDTAISMEQIYEWLKNIWDKAKFFETRHRRKDGSIIDVEINAKGIQLNGKKYLYASARDITERKAAEARLQQLATIVEFSDDAIFSETLEGVITSWNKGAETLFGYSEHEAVGRNVAFLLPGKELKEEFRILERIIQGQSLTHYQAQRVCKNDRIISVSLTISPLYDADNEIIGASKIVRDITKLKESEERFHTLFVHSPDAMLIVETQDRVIVDCNRAAENILRGERTQIIGESPSRFCPLQQPDGCLSVEMTGKMMALAQEKGIHRYEWVHQRLDGDRFWADVSMAPISMEGEKVLLVSWRDISRQKEIALQLRSALNRLEMATRAAAMGIWVWDVVKNTLAWDERMFEIYGVPGELRRQTLTYDFWLERVHPEDQAAAEQQMVEQLDTKDPKDCVFRILLPDQQIRYIKAAVYPEYDERGDLRRVVGTNRDVTTARMNEQKLAESESQFRQFFERNHSVMLLIDPDSGTIYSANQAAVNYYGYSEDEITGMSINRINILPDDVVSQERQSAKSEQTNYFLFKHKRASGEIRDVEAYVTPIKVKGEVRLFSIIHDVTDRRLAQAALEEANRKTARHGEVLQHILDTVNVAIFLGDGKGLVTLANKRAAEMFGYPLETMIGMDYALLVHPSQRIDSRKAFLSVRNHEVEVLDNERLCVRQDGTQFWGHLIARLFSSAEGGEVQIVASVADITPYKNAQQELIRAKDEAEEASRHKSEFLANMSHEIRTPLNGIIGLTHLMQNTSLSGKQQDYLTKIDSSSKALLQVLNDILDYSKIEAGYLHLEPGAFYVDDLLQSISDLFSILAEDKGLLFLFDVAPDVPQYLEGDQLRLLQVLSNLVGNAVKFTEHGEIRVSIELLSSQEQDVSLKFAVEDTGIGIPVENQAKLFQAFHQADGSTTRRFGGTGLGLSISKKMVELMGGEIGVDSVVEQGSTFYFSIPMKIRHDMPLHRDPANLRGMRVLLVDDQASARTVLGQILDSWDFEVTEASSADACLAEIDAAVLAQQPYELLIVDWDFPGMNGFEIVKLARQSHEQSGLGHLPAVVTVSSAGRELARSMPADLSVDVLIDKPLTSSQLFDVIIDLQQQKHIARNAVFQEHPTDSAEKTYPFPGARVLLVEDNKVNQQVAGELLHSLGFDVTTADNGREALDFIEREEYDAVLLDLQMPIMDGYETTRQIRSEKKRQNLPVIAMTAAALIQDKEKCLAAGMNDHIAKPIDPDMLVATLAKWIKPQRDITGNDFNAQLQVENNMGEPFALPGFDLQSAVRRMGGNWTALHKTLNVFLSEFSTMKQSLLENIEQRELRQAAKNIHTIKGASGNIGAVRLHDAAAAFEQELKSGSDAGWKRFEEAYDETIQVLEQACDDTLQPEEMDAPPAYDMSELRGLLADLKSLLQQQRIVPEKLLTDLSDMVSGTKMDAPFRRLVRQVDGFEYADAVNAVNSIEELFSSTGESI